MKHARIRYQGRVHQVTVEDANAVRLADVMPRAKNTGGDVR